MARREEERRHKEKVGGGGLYSRGVVRTRGFVPVPPPTGAGGAPIRVRGAVRTRGPATKVEPWQGLKPEELGDLLEEVREAQERYPLTVVVENPQASEAQAFIEHLHAEDLLGSDDVLWVMGDGKYEQAIPEVSQEFVQSDVYLNAQLEEQRTLVDTLVPDVLFVADADADKLKERLAKWQRRVWAVVLAGPDDFQLSTLDLTLGIPGENGNRWRLRWLSDRSNSRR